MKPQPPLDKLLQSSLRQALQLHQRGQLGQAEALYRQILALQPDHVRALQLYGLLLHQSGRHQAAVRQLEQAIALAPDQVDLRRNLAMIQRESGALEAAAAAYRQAIRLEATHAETHYNLGYTLSQLGQKQEAARAFQQAVKLDPGLTPAHFNLAFILANNHQEEPAEKHYREALALEPTHPGALYNLAVLLRLQDRLDEARALYSRLLAGQSPPNIYIQLERDMLFPAVLPDAATAVSLREQLRAALGRYPAGGINLADAAFDFTAANPLTILFLNYHNQDDRALKEQFAGLFTVEPPGQAGGATTEMKTAPHPTSSRRGEELSSPPAGGSEGGRISSPPNPTGGPSRHRVGVLVSYSHEGIFTRAMGGLFDQLNTAEFELTIICDARRLDYLRERLRQPAHRYLPLSGDIRQAIAAIRQANLDLLYFWEVGSDSTNYFLPFFRLAPVQVTGWGSMATTGLSHIDHFVSSAYFEPSEAQQFYTEKLAALEAMPTWFERPPLPEPLKPRAAFGLSADHHLYACLQANLKFHPDFDPMLAEILRRDPAGRLLVAAGKNEQMTRVLARWRRDYPAMLAQVIELPHQAYPDYLNVLAQADVLLDPIHFNGGVTTYEGLASGTPLVTLPGRFMIGRMAAGALQRIGVTDTLAASPEEYVESAVRLGTDSAFNQAVRRKILAANHVLYEDDAAVRAIEDFFRAVIEQQRSSC